MRPVQSSARNVASLPPTRPHKMHAIILAALAAVTTAMPSYIAVPADQIAFVDLSELRVRRVPRQTLEPPPPQHLPQALYQQDYQPIQFQHYQQQPIALAPPQQPEAPARLIGVQNQQKDVAGAGTLGRSLQYAERPPDFGEYVDFGAHTGDNGAFGWYADFPINNHEDSSYRK
ncbi:unnamed protein product [Arctia plantaginis]|uniref:Uncharacterized protein n=1 Tax=Arctia plantaginis TaxID=874455 RepID=A0A8S1B2B8_ARCPL|nr:unnamed protein product [Arctia plantaginis]